MEEHKGNTVTEKEYVVRAAKMMSLVLIRPTHACPGILAHDWAGGFGRCVVDATTWGAARQQINAFALQRSR